MFFGFFRRQRLQERVFTEMQKNGKLDKIMMEAEDKSSNPLLTLPYGNMYSTAYVFSFLEKNYPLLFEMYNN